MILHIINASNIFGRVCDLDIAQISTVHASKLMLSTQLKKNDQIQKFLEHSVHPDFILL